MEITIRSIKKEDNAGLSYLIKKVFREFGIDKPGTVYTDPQTDYLYELFATPKSKYWVAEKNEIVLGGCGIFPTLGLPDGYAELVKFYLSSEARGKGIGKALLQSTLLSAKELGFSTLYLESFPELRNAITMYQKAGFNFINKQLGNSGHHACTIWMTMKL